ncbi:MAG: EI24 domain-containing protein [Symbiopectobacterium sp.]
MLYLIHGIGQTWALLLWFGFSAWMLAIQFCDYPFDNHKISFPTMREALRRYKLNKLQFGALVSVFTLVPFLNLVVMPVAVCGATAGRRLWRNRIVGGSVSSSLGISGNAIIFPTVN